MSNEVSMLRSEKGFNKQVMAIKCPHGGTVLYLDCLECEDKKCKENNADSQYKENIHNFSLKSKIYKLYTELTMYDLPYSVGIDFLGGQIFSYSCSVADYSIVSIARNKTVIIYKTQSALNKPWLKESFVSGDKNISICEMYSRCEKPVSYEKLAKLAGDDWTKYCGNPTKLNLQMMRLMQEKCVNILLHNKDLYYLKNKKKYVAKDFYEFLKNDMHEEI